MSDDHGNGPAATSDRYAPDRPEMVVAARAWAAAGFPQIRQLCAVIDALDDAADKALELAGG